MGDVSETTTKRKKKGRPSLLDLQKRSLKHQQNQKQQNKRKDLTLTNSYSNVVTEEDDHSNEHREATYKRRKIDPIYHGSDQTDGEVSKGTDRKHGSEVVVLSGPTTPLPDKKLLLFILDRLQKKDTHEVFSKPVDPEELPDYHDIIKHPMDFGTVRKKLDEGLYLNFEQFENDVFLICSNAMQYNSQDTIYYRQARAMQEIAKKDFDNLRQDSDSDSEPQQPKIVQRGRPPRKSLGMSPSERIAPESSSDATLASGGDIASGSNGYNLRKGLSKFQMTDSSVRASHGNSGGHPSWVSEWENEFPASVLKAVLRYGTKQFVVDETRRDTYRCPVALGNKPPVLDAFEDNVKQLLTVGLHSKHSYARSLSHFAADLGPAVWKIAARKISSVLPTGHEFGPGWVADDDLSPGQQLAVCDEKSLDPAVLEDCRSSFASPLGSFSRANASCLQSGDMAIDRELNYQKESNHVNDVISGGGESMFPGRIQPESMVHSDDFSSNGRLGSTNISPQMKMVRLSDLITGSSSARNAPQMFEVDTTNKVSSSINPPLLKTQFFNKSSQLGFGLESQKSLSQGLAGNSSWHELEVPTKQKSFSVANDISEMIGATNSLGSNGETGPLLQPNLALQL